MAVWEIALVATLTVVLLFLFIRELLPVPITALLGIVVLAATGILTIPESFSGFSNPATMTILSMFVLSAGIQMTGVIQDFTNMLLKLAGKNMRRQLIAIGLTVAPLSGIVNNTPVVAVLIPAVKQMANRVGVSPSMFLMPLSFFSMLGGMLTLIGTSTNLLGNAILPGLGVEPFGFFEFMPIGLVALGAGLVYMLTLGVALLPRNPLEDSIQKMDLKGFMAEYEVPKECDAVGRSLEELGLAFGQGVQVVRIIRASRPIDAPSRFVRLEAEDQLLIEGSRLTLGALPARTGLVELPTVLHPLEDEDENHASAEVVITTGSKYVGKTIAEIDFRNRYEALVMAVRHQGRMEIGPLAKSRLMPGDVLLVKASKRSLERMREKPDLYVTRERSPEQFRRNKLPLAVAILTSVVAISAFGLLDVSIAALAGAVAMVAFGVLRMDEFIANVHWDVVLLLGGIIPLGIAMMKTGLATILADGIVGLGSELPTLGFLILVFVFTSLLTQVLSNSAAVVLMLPVAVGAAIGIHADPRQVALVVIFAASTAMMTPIGYQTNTMVYSQGHYTFKDFFRVGGPLNLILAFVVPFSIYKLM